ncbi:hypothetical protein M1M34_gp078 [Haloarcula tailed virus 2]|uniref:Uncharacterized protein n=1 Tax=Haloarcula tailed virus 2 TaxID=2877989 RepID=A0AAE8XZY6_9CAUD|nr:hypothetical protein M1M34_gp078 [Haloarcula tailed virus 2]UBF23255.1 hypothetical protein HATV-2_gp104 [Haloarcula tailed virus 2]
MIVSILDFMVNVFTITGMVVYVSVFGVIIYIVAKTYVS